MEEEEEELVTPYGSSVPLRRDLSRSDADETEDDELFVAEWHPPLAADDALMAMDTTRWCHEVERAGSPVSNYSSMESDGVRQTEVGEEQPATSLQFESTGSFSSCYSYDSDDCEIRRPKAGRGNHTAPEPVLRPELIRPDGPRHPALNVGFVFKALCKALGTLPEGHLRIFKRALWSRYPETFTTPPQFMDLLDLVDRLLEAYDLEVSLQILRALLNSIGRGDVQADLEQACIKNEVRYELIMTLKKKYGPVNEGGTPQGGEQSEQRDIGDVFSNIQISYESNNGPNLEHEEREIKGFTNLELKNKTLTLQEMLGTGSEMIEKKYTRKVMMAGMAGMGKSVVVQKVIRDWAEGRSHHHIYFLFPLPFRELNQFRDATMSFMDIIHALYPETKRLKNFTSDEGEVMFICDGLDEYTGELDFRTRRCNDPETATSLEILVVNFLKGHIYFQSYIWITSRPKRARCIPQEYLCLRAEMIGFSDDEKEAYFRRKFEDPTQADRVIAHLRSHKTLYIMCHVPLFCWLASEEFRRAFGEGGSQAELPGGITLMHTKYLLALLSGRSLRAPARTAAETIAFLVTLGKLAYVMLEKGEDVRIDRDQLKESGVDFVEAVVNSGLCSDFDTEEIFMVLQNMFCFSHATMQEYLAALHVFLTFENHGKNALEQPLKGKLSWLFKENVSLNLYKSAVEKSLHCEDGRLDVFLRFLLGMALKVNHDLLGPFLTTTTTSASGWSPVTEDIAAHLKKVIGENRHPKRNANLQRCLEELDLGTWSKPSRKRSSLKSFHS